MICEIIAEKTIVLIICVISKGFYICKNIQ